MALIVVMTVTRLKRQSGRLVMFVSYRRCFKNTRMGKD